MSEPFFIQRGKGLTAAGLAALTGARLDGKFSAVRVSNIAALDRAGPGDLSFAETAADERALRNTRAGACFVSAALAKAAPAGLAALVVDEPYAAFVIAAQALFPD